MNLLEQLSKELSVLHLNDLEKARYVYLRCCEIFSFDSRVYFTDLFDDTQLRNKILRKRFNIENITEKLVVCHSFSKYILKPLIEILTTLPCTVVKDKEGHSYIIIEYLGKEWMLDATNKDLARVKLALPTKGFTSCVEEMDLVIPEMDANLGFSNKSVDDYQKLIIGNDFTEKIMSMGIILKNSNAKYYYSDASFLIEEVLDISNFSSDNGTYVDFNYNFRRLIDIPHDYSFFELSKDKDEYTIKKIKKIDYDVLRKYLKYKK